MSTAIANVIAERLEACDPYTDDVELDGCKVTSGTNEVTVLGDRESLRATGCVPLDARFAGDNPPGVRGKLRGSCFRDAEGRACRLSRADWRGYPFCLTIKRTKQEEKRTREVYARAERDRLRISEIQRELESVPSSHWSAEYQLQQDVRYTLEMLVRATQKKAFDCTLDSQSEAIVMEAIETIASTVNGASITFDPSRREALVKERNYLMARKADPEYRQFIGQVIAAAVTA